MVRREGQAEFFSHHAQSLHMGRKDNAMTRYWQYQVGQTIQEHLSILKVGKSSKNWPKRPNSLRLLMVRRDGQAEFYSHHAQSLHMGPKDNAKTRYCGNIRLAKQSRNIYLSWKSVKVQNLAHRLAMVNGKEGRAG